MTLHPDLNRLERLDRLSRRMDTAFRIPIIGRRIGWDGLLGLVPGIGDALTVAPAAYIVLESHRMGLPPEKVARQVVNVGIDSLVGLIPLVGDVFDIGFKANRRNVGILREHVEARVAAAARPVGGETVESRPVRRS
ncbi:protein of unknown function [Palleronia marisminoris]|uniref:DUF4112 domain-containing protein n=1 Tax=Palleronia marisminoris TaxID=315423 RepID=A0A1Y5TAY9_9RHOB|nr:DUF4112 domain-containing protein [Palleronia marisminoris]SFH22487.1 protein of unknown function [Palleronia marisminoris]SLN57896.1 hypothetical protein PAM7066_02809 [Palleronia marisminoris]